MRPIALWLACLVLLPTSAGAAEVPEELGALQRRIIEVSERVKPSVVHVEAIVRVNDRRNKVTGSGLVASADGRILTNQHVVHKAEKVTVSIPGRKKKYPARLVGTDKQTDIALLRIEPDTPLPAVTFGRVEDVEVGQWVLAVGNPYGLDGTVSFGIVSAKGRNLEIPQLLNDFIQTDAMIDRGSSGGPLVDLDGRVIGINSRGQGRGIGFTIPVDTALDVMRQLEGGGIARGYLGVTMQPLDRDLATYFGVPDVSGLIVNSVTPESPAARSGLRPGDFVTAFNGVPVEAEKDEDLGAFQRMVAAVPPGEKARLTILRGKKVKEVEVRLGAQPKVEPAEEETDVGFHVQEITEHVYRSQRLGTRTGAYVSFVARGSPAAEAGLVPGDVIRRIESHGVDDLEDFRKAIDRVAERSRFLIETRRGEETKYLLMKRGASPTPAPATDDPGEAGRSLP